MNYRPEVCGHCGSANTQAQPHWINCLNCGKQSNLDGTPIEGNGHFWANPNPSFPWARQGCG